MLYLTSKFHDNRVNTFGFMEGGGDFVMVIDFVIVIVIVIIVIITIIITIIIIIIILVVTSILYRQIIFS